MANGKCHRDAQPAAAKLTGFYVLGSKGFDIRLHFSTELSFQTLS